MKTMIVLLLLVIAQAAMGQILFFSGTSGSVVAPGQTETTTVFGFGQVQPPSGDMQPHITFGYTNPTGQYFATSFALEGIEANSILTDTIFFFEGKDPSTVFASQETNMQFSKSVLTGPEEFTTFMPAVISGIIEIHHLQLENWNMVSGAINWLQIEGDSLTLGHEYTFGSIRVNSEFPVDYSGSWISTHVEAIPEPSTCATIAGALALFIALIRRRRKPTPAITV